MNVNDQLIVKHMWEPEYLITERFVSRKQRFQSKFSKKKKKRTVLRVNRQTLELRWFEQYRI